MVEFPVESILSARQTVSPKIAGDYVYFISDMSAMMSLYRMKKTGSFPERLLPAGLALQNPHLMAGSVYELFPNIGKILIMVDEDGNELYQPSFIPMEGGMPEPIFGDKYQGQQIACTHTDVKRNIAYFNRDDRTVKEKALQYAMKVDLATLEELTLGVNEHGLIPVPNEDHTKVFLSERYLSGDTVTYLWEEGEKDLRTILGTPLKQRKDDHETKIYNVFPIHWFENGALVHTTEFDDHGGFAFMDLDAAEELQPVSINGIRHTGIGEIPGGDHIDGNRFMVEYNVDGCSWKYEITFDLKNMNANVKSVIVGEHPLDGGVSLGVQWDKTRTFKADENVEYIISFTSATQPSQLYLYTPGGEKETPLQLTRERILGIPQELFSPGEDASYESFDGLRVSSRLYLPSEKLGYQGKRPLVLYVHGGPQGQERPDFTWFSMPLIQLLTLNGFAVFVPNVRGSTGYGLEYRKLVDHDWGGNDRLDHIEGLKFLETDPRIDSSKRGIVGRSYGGYMTLTLATRHPDLWNAACDMFGPYNLITFVERLPESWAAYFYLSIGHPEKDAEFLKERSPSTYMDQLKAPLLVIQGKNDPRVVENESHDIVDRLNESGKQVEYLMFEDEGHDVLKFNNKVTVYNRIVEFFKKSLQP